MPVMQVRDDEEVDGPAARTKVAVAARESEDTDLLDMISGFGADKGYEVRVYRTSPKKWEGVSIEGHLDTFEEWQSEEDLKNMYGGGTFQLKIHRPGANGRMEYLKAVSVKLPGPPRGQGIDEKEEPQVVYDHAPAAEDSVLAQQAMRTMKELIDKKNENKGFDPVMMQMMMAPMQAQIASSQAALAQMQADAREKDARIMELIAKKPDTSEKDGLLNKMFDTEASRTNNLRAVHESEMRSMRENAREDIKRAEDRHRDELRDRSESHRRELEGLQRSTDAMMATTKMAYDARIDSLKADIARLGLDLTEARAELGALRLKKDKTLIEQASELQAVGESLRSLGLGGGGKDDDEDDRKWYEKILGQALENPESIGQFAGMITGNNPARQQAAPQQQFAPPAQLNPAAQEVDVDSMPIGEPFRGPDGNVYVKVPPDGSIVTYDQALKMAQAQEAQQNKDDGRPSPGEVKAAIGFMESAFQAGTDSATFATSAKAMIPQNILKYMERVGVDTFLNEVAVLEQGSPLRNQAGRTYMREVAKYLLEGIPG